MTPEKPMRWRAERVGNAGKLYLYDDRGELLAVVQVQAERAALVAALITHAPAGADALAFCAKLERAPLTLTDELRADLSYVLGQVRP